MTGKVVHFEVPAKNLKRAKDFYTRVFGWQMNDVQGMDYTLVGTVKTDKNQVPTEPGAINGGMVKLQKPFSGPVITIQVDDINASLKDIGKHGGKTVTKKTSMGEWGSFGYFKDSEGNLMGLFQAPAKA